MHFFKTLSVLTASMATLTTAAPMPGAFNAVVDTSGFVEEAAAPTATSSAAAAALTAAATSQQAPSQHAQAKDILELATPAGASSAAAVVTSEAPAVAVTTVTIGAPASAQTAAASAPAATTMTVEPTPEAASQPSQTVATTAAASSATSAPFPSATTSSSSSGSSSGSSSPSSSGGSGLTIINKCSKDVQAQEFQGLHSASVGSNTPTSISANGGTAQFPMSGASQTVKVFWSGVDIYSGSNTNSEIEWTTTGGSPFFDLSLLTGNPFLQYGQKLESPCKVISCAPGDANCEGAYFPGGADATTKCPALGQGQGLTYTLCES